MTSLQIHGRAIQITHPNKVMYPGEDVMKGDVLHYYNRIAATMMRHVEGRVVSMLRFPEGIRRIDCRSDRMADTHPGWIRTWHGGGPQTEGVQVVVEEPATLAFLAQQACLTPLASLSRVVTPTRPDRLIFDLDPWDDSRSAFDGVCQAALMLGNVLHDAGLVPFVMTSGSRGLHVHVPIFPEMEFGWVMVFARTVAESVAEKAPGLVTTIADQDDGKVLIDYMRNAYTMTSVVPYGLRALSGAPVAAPLDWDEFGSLDAGAREHTMASIFTRLSLRGDPWALGSPGDARLTCFRHAC
jgi:bifunctional non-homologous end joining protein LigD